MFLSAACDELVADVCADEIRVGPEDVFLAEIEACSVCVGAAHFEYWRPTRLIIEVVPEGGCRIFSRSPPKASAF